MHAITAFNCILLLVASLIVPLTSQAALLSRLGGQAYYDDVLDITWLADANLAASNRFGVSGINGGGAITTWDIANAWIAGMNRVDYLGFDDWRLPTLSPVSGDTTFNAVRTYNGTTDRGYGVTGIGWATDSGEIVSEMGWMFYGNLGNLGTCTQNDTAPATCLRQAGSGLVNTGPFSNISRGLYWSGVEASSTEAWVFGFGDGIQFPELKDGNRYAWAVRSGDVDVDAGATVPLPSAMLLLSAGLVGIAGVRRRARLRSADARGVTPTLATQTPPYCSISRAERS